MGKDLSRYFPKEDTQMAKKHMKRCSTSLIIREIQITTTVRYHHTSFRTAIIKKSTNSKCWRWCAEKEILLHCWWECKLMKPLQRIIQSFLKNLKIESPYNPTIPLLGIYPEKNIIQNDICTPVFTVAIFRITNTYVLSYSAVSESLQPHGQQPTRLLCLWDIFKQEYRSGLPFPTLRHGSNLNVHQPMKNVVHNGILLSHRKE